MSSVDMRAGVVSTWRCFGPGNLRDIYLKVVYQDAFASFWPVICMHHSSHCVTMLTGQHLGLVMHFHAVGNC